MYIRCIMEEKKLIKSAPARQTLKCFGGSLDIEEFRKHSSSTIRACIPVFEHKIYEFVEQKKSENFISGLSNNADKMKHINGSNCENDSLRLQRNKPLKRDATNNLERSLGLFK